MKNNLKIFNFYFEHQQFIVFALSFLDACNLLIRSYPDISKKHMRYQKLFDYNGPVFYNNKSVHQAIISSTGKLIVEIKSSTGKSIIED